MPHPSRYFKLPKTSLDEMMREWMARQTEANERMKNQPTKSLPRTINTKLRHEFVYKPPLIRNENDKDDVLLNHVGDKELKSYDGAGTRRMKKKEKDDKAGNGEEDAWRRNQLIIHAYASLCVAFIVWSSIAISHARKSGFL
ncbi:hypothetical protein Tco_0088142 [Tanacetum coccineum]